MACMKLKTKFSHSQSGLAHILPIFLIVLIVGVGFAAYRVIQSKDKDQTGQSSQTSSSDKSSVEEKYIEWSFNGDSWAPMNEGKPAPKCEEPLSIQAPMDVSKATSALYPGQVRGGDYKPHGGIGTDNATDTKLEVKMPYDAYLYRGAKYQENGEIQYVLDFIAPCGIMIRFDHLKTLSPKLEEYTKELPTGSEGDSRTTKFTNNAAVKQGTVLATEVGHSSPLNVFFDLGVYDLRQANEVSKDPAFAEEPKRKSDKEQSYFAVCWFDLLIGDEKTTVLALPARGSEGKTSDYCK